MRNSDIIGVDFGGTNIKAVLIDRNGNIIKKVKEKTKRKKQEVINQIMSIIKELDANKNIRKIGVGVPGVLNKEKTKIIRLPNISGWENTELKKIIEQKITNKLNVLLENDGNCMALGESMFGAGKEIKNLVCITIGTGVGGGIILNNKIHLGRGYAGEFGHLTVKPNGHKCGCGSNGCLEEYVSARGIERLAKSISGTKKNVFEIEKSAKAGDKKLIRVYNIAGAYLGIGISNIMKIIDPELILIGGGVSNSGGLLFIPAIKEMKKRTFFKPGLVKKVKLGDNAGAIGAACLHLRK